jgi:isoquinoline 1-oxidoreductase beta subunit
MTTAALDTNVSRRQVMVGALGLSFAFVTSRADAAVLASMPTGTRLSPWVGIDSDGSITIMSPATEMGQGSLTSLPRILAEELDADWSKVKVVPAPPIGRIYGNPSFGGMMYTAGSNAVRSYYDPLRMFGAQVRRVLLDNAARRWNVPLAELTTEPSVVVHAKSGRRLTYAEIAAFADVPAEPPHVTTADLKPVSAFRLIGHDAMRVELPLKVNGTAQYAIDVQLPGMLYATVLRAPIEGSSPEDINDTAARAISGVIRTVRLDYGVGVLAETPYAAIEARQALIGNVTWSGTGTAQGFDSDRASVEFARAARDLSTPGKPWEPRGNADAALSRATTLIEAEYLNDYTYHAQMEPLNAVASLSPSAGVAQVWCGTQSQTMAQEAVAKVLGVGTNEARGGYHTVVLHDTLMGGGFGRRGHRDEEFVIDAVLMSKAADGKPVKVIWTREDDVRNGRMRPLSAHYLRAGLDASGKIIAWHQRIAVDRVLPFADPVRYENAMQRDGIVMRGTEFLTYDIPNLTTEQLYRDTGVRTSPLRGVGWTANFFAAEAFLDEIASARKTDPVALRLELLKDFPRGRRVVERVAEMAEWNRPRANGRALGFAFVDYSNTPIAGIVEASVDRATGKIRVHDVWCTLDCGIAVHPDNVVAQTESSIVYGLGMSLMERITVKDGAIRQSNFFDYPVPRMNEIPEMHIELIRTNNRPTGVGQMATPIMAPAIANAIARITGKRLRESPMTPDRVKRALA